MLIVTNAGTDHISLTTSSAAAVHAHASWTDLLSGAVTPGRTNTSFSSATTTDIVGTPALSTTRNVKTLHIRNTDVIACTVTVNYNQNGTIFQLHSVTLNPGDALEYIEGTGFFTISSAQLPWNVGNSNSGGAVVASTADTYLTGSSLPLVNILQAGLVLRWRFSMTKTGAGVATPIYTVRLGTNGTTADTSLGTFTGVAQTGVIDTGWHEMELIVQTASSSGTGEAVLRMDHKLTTTGLANAAQVQILQIAPTAVNWTQAGGIIGVSCNPGASGIWTFQTVSVSAHNVL